MSFVHLHNHTHYSILNALAKPKEYIKLAKEHGSPAIAITDSGVVYGAIEFYKAAKAEGIKPIIGLDAFVAPMGLDVKTAENRYSSLVLLAKNNTGYQNLLKLSTIASLEGFYYKPRIDNELLAKHSEGLIGLSGSLHGAIPKAILENDVEKAKELIKTYQDIFGKEDFYLELQHHPEIANWSIVNSKLVELAKETAAPLVAANDCHYTKPEDAEAHDVLICVQTQKTVHEEHRFKYVGNYSLRSPEEMIEAFRFCPEAVENTLKIAEKCNVDITFGENKIPYFDTGDKAADVYLRELCEAGLKERYGENPSEEEIARLNFELDIIHNMGFDTYFLIVWDFIKYAKEKGIVVGPGRGSAAGSIISYCLRITDLDPLKYGLLFERFLNPERVSMPDIDVDFADTRREEVLEYVVEKYGEDKVAQIITFGTLAPKAAIRDSGRALGYTYSDVDAVAKTVPDAIFGKYAPLAESIENDPEMSTLYEKDSTAKNILDMAVRIEGTIRQAGTHACAVIISRDPLVEHTAMQKATGNKEGVVTQYSMKPCESLGLLKMDFLGLKNLTIMETTLGILKRTKPDVEVDLENLPMDDEKTFELLQSGTTTGVFQLESPGMRRYLKDLKPTEFGDIIAMVSLYRPGPMQFISTYIDGKHGKQKVTYLHESLEPILKETYGIAIYQEQILQLARVFSGFSLGEADLLRRAIGKKVASELTAQREKFIEGAIKNGHTKRLAVKMFDDVIEPFAGYGFNKSHAACYALIAYQTAYLKAHFPAEFMAALLTADAENTDRVVIEIEECRLLGIEVLPPNVNESLAHFTVVDEKTIRFGLTAIKGIGEGPVRELIRVRDEGDEKFTGLENFAKRVPFKILNKKTIGALACSGSLDELGERAQLAASYDQISTYAKHIQTSAADGQTDIFAMLGEEDTPDLQLAKVPSMTQSQYLTWEKDFLGLYVSGHPLQGLSRYFKSKGRLIGSIGKKQLDKRISVGGLVSQYRRVMTKAGKYMCFGEIEDPSAKIPFVLFPRAYDIFGDVVELDRVLKFEGKIDERSGTYQMMVDKVTKLSLDNIVISAKERGTFDEDDRIVGVARLEIEENEPDSDIETYIIKLESDNQPEVLAELKPLLQNNKGKVPVEIHIPSGDILKRIKVPFGVKMDDDLKKELKELLAV
ncbi:DNA polymerase III subunit alpha [Candidatus Peregrinibacteria bacterium]|jgi:DNA polymerase III subunit alpha|nr:DNA polymerase III subunit alpha [Candidatus Peregrinibacteria bacterium]MBT4631929.1 DNA polymerase III subunit alpha [Candidatus Peregrinibacteria bacterium]MBT5516459.1 DNA polymerase III subunit alpha [Candidatus Peregrinibacteria bacterium]MBT5823684.1 DNA polymerase III subunit alpha [Candidatus Peregrinibacteria bacterium]